jgi:hypothetical protein
VDAVGSTPIPDANLQLVDDGGHVLLVSMRRITRDTVRAGALASHARTIGLNPNSLAIKPIRTAPYG